MHSNEVKSDVPQCFSVLFHGRVFAESVCLQDKWPFSRRRWQATQRWYWIDFWNVAERTVWCIRADMNHKNSIKKPLECLTAEYYFWWLIWVGHYGGAPVKSPPTKLLLVPSWIPQHSLSPDCNVTCFFYRVRLTRLLKMGKHARFNFVVINMSFASKSWLW